MKFQSHKALVWRKPLFWCLILWGINLVADGIRFSYEGGSRLHHDLNIAISYFLGLFLAFNFSSFLVKKYFSETSKTIANVFLILAYTLFFFKSGDWFLKEMMAGVDFLAGSNFLQAMVGVIGGLSSMVMQIWLTCLRVSVAFGGAALSVLAWMVVRRWLRRLVN